MNDFVKCKKIRHPIIERIQIDIEYITNDIELTQEGILLFGPNACGQSSAQRAVDIKKEINKKSLIKGWSCNWISGECNIQIQNII